MPRSRWTVGASGRAGAALTETPSQVRTTALGRKRRCPPRSRPRSWRLTLDEIVDLCAQNGIRSGLPYSQLEAEAIWRGIDILDVIRRYLLARLQAAGIL